MRGNGRALLIPTSPLRVWSQPRGRAATTPLGCQDSHTWWGCPHSGSSPTTTSKSITGRDFRLQAHGRRDNLFRLPADVISLSQMEARLVLFRLGN